MTDRRWHRLASLVPQIEAMDLDPLAGTRDGAGVLDVRMRIAPRLGLC